MERPGTTKRAVATGREMPGRRSLGRKVLRYPLRVSKGEQLPSFPVFLAERIEALYPNPSAFARAAGVSPSAVSRWLSGELRPTPKTLERLAAPLKTRTAILTAIAYPELAVSDSAPDYAAPAPVHPAVRNLARLLAEDSPVPPEERDTLERVVESVIQPYLRHLKARRRTA